MLPQPEAHQCCSGAYGDLIEVLEGGYGHSFRVGGLGHGPLRPPWAPPPPPLGGVWGGQKSDFQNVALSAPQVSVTTGDDVEAS